MPGKWTIKIGNPFEKTSKRYERAKERADNGIQRAVQLHQHSDKCRLKPRGSTSHPSHWYHPFLYSSFMWVWGQWGRSDTAGGHLHCCKPSGKESGSIWYTQVSRHPGTPNLHSWRRPCAQRQETSQSCHEYQSGGEMKKYAHAGILYRSEKEQIRSKCSITDRVKNIT